MHQALVLGLLAILCHKVVSAQSSCPSGSLPFTAHFEQATSAWDHYWERCVGSGHATLALRQDWREQLAKIHADTGFQRVRFHGLFDDDMSAFLPDHTPKYSWFNVDSIYDFLLSIGMQPLVELSFMPEGMASGNETIFHYKGNITPPKKWSDWADLLTNFAKHLLERYLRISASSVTEGNSRYGPEEVHKWYFETWNEPNCGFWTGTQQDYFQLLKVTSAALKAVDPKIQVGGPATCQSQWLNDTIDFCKKNNVQIDFISTHEYPTDPPGPNTRDYLKNIMTEARKQVGNMPLYYTEYNDGLFEHQLHDTIYASAFAVFNVIDLYGIPDLLSWWTFSDIFEEGGFVSTPFNEGYGLQTIYGIPKPSYRAFQLLHQSGDRRVAVEAGNYPTAGILVTKNATHAQILAYNHNVPGSPIKTETLCIQLTGLNTSKQYNAVIQRIDENNANPLAMWQAMGSPQYLNNDQIQALMKASEIPPHNIVPQVVGSSLVFTIDLMPEGVAAITFAL